MRTFPDLQHGQLRLGVEPVFPVGQKGQLSPGRALEAVKHGIGSQLVSFTIEHLCGGAPAERMLPHPAEIRPLKRLPESCGNLPCRLQLFFGHVGLLHHPADEVFHIHDGRNEERTAQCLLL